MSLIWPKPLSSTSHRCYFFTKFKTECINDKKENGEGPFNHSDHLLKIGKN